MAAVIPFEYVGRLRSEATHPCSEFAGCNRKIRVSMREWLWRNALDVLMYLTKFILKDLQRIRHIRLVGARPAVRRFRRFGFGPEMGYVDVKNFDAD